MLTIDDIEKLGLEKTAEIALELAWKDADAVYISFDVDSVDCGFVPGTGWPEPGGFLPREALKLLGLVAAEGLCGLEVVEVSPPYDTSDITALLGVRVVVEALGSHGGARQARQPETADRQAGGLLREATMHRGHDHDHHHVHSGAAGHNRPPPPRAAQWQTPHLPDDHAPDDRPQHEPDLDLVEKAFVESFSTTSDPTSFLRLARIPFEAVDGEGRKLVLLRVETEAVTDIGTLTPHLGGGAMRYDPLPAQMVSQRRRLRFVYFDGVAPRTVTLGEVREALSK